MTFNIYIQLYVIRKILICDYDDVRVFSMKLFPDRTYKIENNFYETFFSPGRPKFCTPNTNFKDGIKNKFTAEFEKKYCQNNIVFQWKRLGLERGNNNEVCITNNIGLL